ncbi:putative quinone oxidoreductase [Mytilinidion resinicola]|uniref:Quinone oxidoreductase n=1 Tax=Mytilinidion resinicola TaxID=574789 RepID=A0A6A6YGU1_9PEZI|nr:putative quinone oxidoreductase [Mytilinidion resinicola]KAF2808036.1 putative quinone oxidoreductase [Mytilinidion resinicola]
MPETIRAVDIKGGTGPADSLFITSIPKPVPAAAQALVKIKAFGLNRMDLFQREGHYPLPPQAGKILGVEFSGIIEGVGEDPEKGFKVGDEVFGLAYGGAYAEYIAVSTHMLVHKPKELSWEECAGIPETWITATQALYLIGCYTPGKSVLWHAGASSVSIAGIQLSLGDSPSAVFATARQDSKCEFITNTLGATAAFNTSTQDWPAEVLKATNGKGVDVIIDFVGASYFQGNLDAIARDGVIVTLGMLGGTVLPAGVDISAFVWKRARFEGSSLRSRDEEYQGKLRDTLVEHALPRFVDGRFKVFVEKVFPWEEVVEAHRLMEANKTMGKIICRVE